MNAEVEHHKCVEVTIEYFQERNIQCLDLEKIVGHQSVKRPDLLLPDFYTLLEEKALVPQDPEIQVDKTFGKDLLTGEIVGHSPEDFFERVRDHLASSRHKFGVYSDYHTAVVVFDLLPLLFLQSPESLILGQENRKFDIPIDKSKRGQVYQGSTDYTKRQLRRDLNTNIGAVAFHTDGNSFRIFHHHFAEKIRRIDKTVFSGPEDQHFEYIDDSVKPEILSLEERTSVRD